MADTTIEPTQTNSLYGNYRTRTFNDIFTTTTDFQTYMTGIDKSAGTEDLVSKDKDATVIAQYYNRIWFLLSARFGNCHIASSDENQFKLKTWSLITQYGPTWYEKDALQKKFRNFTDDELRSQGSSIINYAYNPSTTVAEGGVIDNINEQNTSNAKRSPVDAYSIQYDILKDDITDKFVEKFKKLFLMIVEPEKPLWYTSDDDSSGS